MDITDRVGSLFGRAALAAGALALAWSVAVLLPSCGKAPQPPQAAHGRVFTTPEEAVAALASAVRASSVDDLLGILGPEANEIVAATDPVSARQRREVIGVAFHERWQLVDASATSKTLVIGNESWPFPIPLVKDSGGWRFDVAAGKEEVIARRIGRNELAAITVCRTYVAAQRLYSRISHDGKAAGLYASTFRSDPGRQNGLYWPTGPGQKRSPLGDLVAYAEQGGSRAAPTSQGAAGGNGAQPSPFHGYYFRILTAQGPGAAGGARSYIIAGAMSGGFALVAWPADYDATGVMTFLVNQDGTVLEQDLGADTSAIASAMTAYDPDPACGPCSERDQHTANQRKEALR